ncbi:sensor histidine kinase [Tessaracoccus terricola]
MAATGSDRAVRRDSSDPGAAASTWRTWGWLMPGIWLLFLIYTVVAVFDASLGTFGTVVGLGIIVLYAATYIAGFNMHMGGNLCRYRFPGWRWVGLGLMWLCIVAQIALIGPGAINMCPFTLAYAAYLFAPRVAWLVAAVTSVGVGLFVRHWAAESFWYIVGIMLGVFLVCVVMRALIEADERATSSRRDLAVISERERVARDVHDGLGHTLTVVAMKAELAERVMEADPERARTELADLRRLTRDALDQVRSTVSGLRETDLPNQVAALTMTLEGAGLEVEVSGDPADVAPELHTALGWVLREAGTNVLRHSGARHCQIVFGPRSVEVLDDGVGVGDAPAGHGRRGMTERLEAVGAELLLEDRPEAGTRLAVTW